MAALILGTARVRGNRVLMSEASSVVFTISCKIIWFSRPINVQYKCSKGIFLIIVTSISS